MSLETVRVLITGALFLHGVAHLVAFVALLAMGAGRPAPAAMVLRSWLLPRLSGRATALLAVGVWAVTCAGFLGAAAAFWGLWAGGDWRTMAVWSSLISILGIILLSGTWPGSPTPRRSLLNTTIALAMDLAILVLVLWLHWPPPGMFGR